MAGPYLCDNQDGLPVAYTIGDAATGQQLFLCVPCTVTWAGMVVEAAGQPDSPAPPAPEPEQVEQNEPAADPAGLSPPQGPEEPAEVAEGGRDGSSDAVDEGDGAPDQLGDSPLELGERESAGGPASGA
ncbi:MAG TPA: hypothetical protein VMV23_00295 [Candidatus Nanopelagicaceae bacterium]|nr:hypothetical protein [Candidatus Nanopelagicaceae bacterium]